MKFNRGITDQNAEVPEELGDPPNLTALLISPQVGLGNPCIPAKLKGQLRTDLPAFLEITPFCDD